MRKAIWLLAGLFALFTTGVTGMAAANGCEPLGANGKLETSFQFDGCTVQVKVVSTLTNACVAVTSCDSSACVDVFGDEGTCSLIAPLDTGDTTVKTSCKNDAGTKIEAKVHCD
jgi:hypothetical protein